MIVITYVRILNLWELEENEDIKDNNIRAENYWYKDYGGCVLYNYIWIDVNIYYFY